MRLPWLTPLAIEFQMAWLVAYNDSLFDESKLEDIPTLLNKLEEQTKTSNLTLSNLRSDWQKAVRLWLSHKELDTHDQTLPT